MRYLEISGESTGDGGSEEEAFRSGPGLYTTRKRGKSFVS